MERPVLLLIGFFVSAVLLSVWARAQWRRAPWRSWLLAVPWGLAATWLVMAVCVDSGFTDGTALESVCSAKKAESILVWTPATFLLSFVALSLGAMFKPRRASGEAR